MGDTKPPVRHTVFEQLLKQVGITLQSAPLPSKKVVFDGPCALTSWEGLIENLVSQK